MNAKTLQIWEERAKARQAQCRIKRKPRRARQVFYVLKSDFDKLRRQLSRRQLSLLIVEDAHIMDVDECGNA